MKNAFAAFGVGLLFALGLGISGMTQVDKVIGFLDVFGAWQPALMFVMGGAIALHALLIVAFIMSRRARLGSSGVGSEANEQRTEPIKEAPLFMQRSIAYRFIIRQATPLFDTNWHLPQRQDITAPLIGGSFLFGIGWGLGGFCPGPALVSLASFQLRPVIFVISMLLGMLLFRLMPTKDAPG